MALADFDGSYSPEAELKIRRAAFYAGVADDRDARRALWRFLLLGESPSLSQSQNRAETRRTKYERIRAQWQSIDDEQASQFAAFVDRRNRYVLDILFVLFY